MLTATEQFSSSARSPQVREFSASVRQMQSELATMSRADRVSQFGFSSIEDTAIPVFDALGQARMSLGKQDDGTYALVYVDGPPPPRPNPPIVSARQLGVFVAIDGTFAGGYQRPENLARFDIHMSTTSGFIPDGRTIVGDVTEAGGRLIGAANVTQYVKVVAVSRAKDSTTGAVIASAPTDEIAVLPLPISSLAAGAVGTQQLAADFAWLSRAVIGNINAGHLELEGRAGMSPGLFAYDNGLDPTFGLDGLTGSVTMRGTLRSADAGERLVWREYSWSNDIRFYPATGSNYAQMYARTTTLGGADYGIMSLFGATYGNRRSYVWMAPDYVAVARQTMPAQQFEAGLTIDSASARMQWGTAGGNMGLSSTRAYLSYGSGSTATIYVYPNDIYLYFSSTSSIDIQSANRTIVRAGDSRFQFSTVGSGAMLWALNTDCGIQMNYTGIDIYNPSTGSYLAVGASAFVVQSARDTKVEIEELPFDPERVIVDAPVSMWERRAEQRDEHGRYRHAQKYVGPMAEDVPEVLRVTVGGEPGLDIARNLGVVWAATARQTARLDALGARLDALGAA